MPVILIVVLSVHPPLICQFSSRNDTTTTDTNYCLFNDSYLYTHVYATPQQCNNDTPQLYL